ncbi:hypothetical protein HPB49_003749 [Dermacentor silvarum]|uniref:Uncharacterized protein n=1 Tax=Dermacentor silvarum TaxID=543639 RepID=A0ACB8CDD4_DERSI|nr:hypothetical protein HPB49_003749 [Dermacentor silvarum]
MSHHLGRGKHGGQEAITRDTGKQSRTTSQTSPLPVRLGEQAATRPRVARPHHQVLPVNNTAAEEAPTLVLLADACNDAQAPSEHAEVSMKCKKGDKRADVKFMLMQAQGIRSEGCRQARDDLGTTEDCASPQGYPNRPTVKTLHHLDHTYSSKESPRSKAKRLEGCLKEARKRIKVLEAKINRHSERSRTLQNMIDEMRSKSLITEEAQTKLEEFGNLPVEMLNNWRKNATEQPRGRRYSIEMKKFATTLHCYLEHMTM